MAGQSAEYRVKVFRAGTGCTVLKFVTLEEAVSDYLALRVPGFVGKLELWDHDQIISAWEGRSLVTCREPDSATTPITSVGLT